LKAPREYMYRPFLALPPNQVGSTVFVHRVTFLIHAITH